MKPLIILAALLLPLLMACAAPEPAVDIPAQRESLNEVAAPIAAVGETLAAPDPTAEPAPTYTPYPTLTPYPTATPAPILTGGICWRSPKVQEWILHRLRVHWCEPVNHGELFRITEGFPVSFPLQPGDLAGLANVPALSVTYGHCGSWEDPEYAAARLQGFNPGARFSLEYRLAVDYQGEDSDLPGAVEQYRSVMEAMIYPDPNGKIRYQTLADLEDYPQLLRNSYDESGFSREELAQWPGQAVALRAEMDSLALAIAGAVKAAGLGGEEIPEVVGPGRVESGKKIWVNVVLSRQNDIADCQD